MASLNHGEWKLHYSLICINFDVKFTVGTYSDGNLLVVYEIRRQVFPTAPSPTTTHLIVCMVCQKNICCTKIIANSILALKNC